MGRVDRVLCIRQSRHVLDPQVSFKAIAFISSTKRHVLDRVCCFILCLGMKKHIEKNQNWCSLQYEEQETNVCYCKPVKLKGCLLQQN